MFACRPLLISSDVHWRLAGRTEILATGSRSKLAILVLCIFDTILIALNVEDVHLLTIKYLVCVFEVLIAEAALHLISVS